MPDITLEEINELRNSVSDEEFESIVSQLSDEGIDALAQGAERFAEVPDQLDASDSLLGPAPREGETIQSPDSNKTFLQSNYTARDIGTSLMGGAGAAKGAQMGAQAGGRFGPGGAAIGAGIGALTGGAGLKGLGEAGAQVLDAAEIAISGDSDPLDAFDPEQVGMAAIYGATEVPLDAATGFFLKTVGGMAGVGNWLKSRPVVARDDLARAVVGDGRSMYQRMLGGQDTGSSHFLKVKKLIDDGDELLLNKDATPVDVYEAAVARTSFPVDDIKRPGDPRYATPHEVEQAFDDAYAADLEEFTVDIAVADGADGSSLLRSIADDIDRADELFAKNELDIDVETDILPKLGNVQFIKGEVDPQALLQSGPDTYFSRQIAKKGDPNRPEKARELAKLLNKHLFDVADDFKLTPRRLQDLKVGLDRATRNARKNNDADFSSPKRDVFVKMSDFYRAELGDAIARVDEVAGTNLTESLAANRQKFQDTKEALPALDKYQASYETGELAQPAFRNRAIPGGALGAGAAGGLAGGTLASMFDPSFTNTGYAVGSIAGAASARKILPSRLARVARAQKSLNVQASSIQQELPYIIVGGNITRNALDLLTSDANALDTMKDAMYSTMLRENGMVNAKGELVGEVTPEMDQQLEKQAEMALAPITNAIRSGDEFDVAVATALVAKQFPSAFPEAQLKGEVQYRGKRILPLEEDRMAYSKQLQKDSDLTPAQKAPMRSVLHDTFEIINPPEIKPSAPKTAKAKSGLEADS